MKTTYTSAFKRRSSTAGGRANSTRAFLDGKAFRPDGKTAATLIPPAFGLAGVNLHTWTGWDSVTYWNAFVANLEMHGQATFFKLNLSERAINDLIEYLKSI